MPIKKETKSVIIKKKSKKKINDWTDYNIKLLYTIQKIKRHILVAWDKTSL